MNSSRKRLCSKEASWEFFNRLIACQKWHVFLRCGANKDVTMTLLAAGLFIEAAVVGIVCVIFLILFIVAGIKQILSNENRD